MHMVICWFGGSHLHLLRRKSNCSCHIVTPFMDVLFGVINTRTIFENLLSVMVTHSKCLINVLRVESGIFDEHNWPYQCGVPQISLQLDEQSNSFPKQYYYIHCQ